MGDSGPLDYAWEESVECQPLQHCAVVHDNQETFNITVKNTMDGLEVQAKVNPTMVRNQHSSYLSS